MPIMNVSIPKLSVHGEVVAALKIPGVTWLQALSMLILNLVAAGGNADCG